MITIIIADDQDIIREGLKMILSLDDNVKIIGEAENGKQLLEILSFEQPDVILMDIRMPVMDGIEATAVVKRLYPNVKIIILTTFDEDEYLFGSLKNGADGYVMKDSGSKAILSAIQGACLGSMILDSSISGKTVNVISGFDTSKKVIEDLNGILTPRELDVVKQLLLGKNNHDIGETLFLTEGTVKNYISHILSKLELSSRAELLVYLQNVHLDH
ncbi:response regulator [Anaerocolumna sedimenticola]|uniref:Stage 0 sporulation protein A homolog n=1 Tax=Anaerocolumna sedimenticola TaxID=2696063 RepID=A0A6P1TVD4_9FIRM|nr:response regulator transcription factor [Anaerocolumna sedimenticola]QHQ63385.1 response regulator [Anaerocolumna sedimenticola]